MNKKEITELARELRRNETKEERELWHHLRAKRFRNLKFQRQHPIIYARSRSGLQFFVADFYCFKEKLVIEVDGPIHNYQIEKDNERDKILVSLGLRVFRIKNEDLNDVSSVLKDISDFIAQK